ncbi:MAG: hypothetical protein AAF236_13325 [Verrucomicrobiota bacterium]
MNSQAQCESWPSRKPAKVGRKVAGLGRFDSEKKTLNPTQIFLKFGLIETSVFSDIPQCHALAFAEFESEDASHIQKVPGHSDQLFDQLSTTDPAIKRHSGISLHFSAKRGALGFGNVGEIRDDEIKALAIPNSRKEMPLSPVDIIDDIEPRRIFLRQRDRILRDIGKSDAAPIIAG